MKLIIVGGVAGGASAAVRARRLSEAAEIIVIERGPDVSFANCGLPYHIGEVIEKRGKLLGAQGVGGAGVDKRIDVMSVAIQAGMTVFDLEEMELCYAPQYGSAKDPVNMAGFVAAGVVRGDHPQTDWEAVVSAPDSSLLLDVRTAAEFDSGHIPGAVNISLDQLRSRLSELPRARPIVAYCEVGKRGYIATRILRQSGFEASNLGGGYKTYFLDLNKTP